MIVEYKLVNSIWLTATLCVERLQETLGQHELYLGFLISDDSILLESVSLNLTVYY